MERSHIALNKWLMGFYIMLSSVSAHQLNRTLNLGYPSAWFMCHRIRKAMRSDCKSWSGLLGGSSKVVEANETYFGLTDEPKRLKKPRIVPYMKSRKSNLANKRAIVALVERGGNVRTFHVPTADKTTVGAIVTKNFARESRLHTDERRHYTGADQHFTAHENVKRSAGEYVGGDVHTDSAEDYFSIFKRGIRDVYHHCKEKYFHRYLVEFAFRYNHRIGLGFSDIGRTSAAIKGVKGKRLMYRQPR